MCLVLTEPLPMYLPDPISVPLNREKVFFWVLVFLVSECVSVYTRVCNWLSPSTMWIMVDQIQVTKLKLRSSTLAVNSFTYRATSLSLCKSFTVLHKYIPPISGSVYMLFLLPEGFIWLNSSRSLLRSPSSRKTIPFPLPR